MGDWKGVRAAGRTVELYDLRTDMAEKNDVAPAHPDVVRRIEEVMRTARTDSKEFPVRKAGPERRKQA